LNFKSLSDRAQTTGLPLPLKDGSNQTSYIEKKSLNDNVESFTIKLALVFPQNFAKKTT